MANTQIPDAAVVTVAGSDPSCSDSRRFGIVRTPEQLLSNRLHGVDRAIEVAASRAEIGDAGAQSELSIHVRVREIDRARAL